MIKLNDSSVYVGQIKQLLKEFNLPHCPVNPPAGDTHAVYIRDNTIYTRKDDQLFQRPYIYNEFISNITTNLRLDNNLYDSYTHRYLGRYLRFLRDYWGVDLMPLYNCFDYKVAEFAFTVAESAEKDATTISFTSDENFTCYAVPVTQKVYSLYIDTALPITYCLGLADMQLADAQEIGTSTLCTTRVVGKQRLELWGESASSKLKDHLDELLLYIKVPTSYRKKIVLLEGDYTGGTFKGTALPINLQLASYQNSGYYLLADKLIQYLSGHVITPMSEDYDIWRLQEYLFKHRISAFKPTGVWQANTLLDLRYWIQDNQKNPRISNRLNNWDILGYLDSDVESSLTILYGEML